jgi:hypothetical protein
VAKDKINETANAVSSRVSGWSIVCEITRPDGTWYTDTITDFPEHVGITINEWIPEYEKEISRDK